MDTKTAVIAKWSEAYAQWENGENVSPSADDLARIANEIDPALPNDESIVDAIWEAECEGNDLTAVYDLVYAAR